MAIAQDFIRKQLNLYMSSWQYALMYSLVFAVLPFTSWLAVVGITLITLRKGFNRGLAVLVPAVVVFYAVSLKSLSHIGAIINTVVLFLPAFMGAVTLRVTANWHAVSTLFFLAIAVFSLLVQIFVPEFVISQYTSLETIIQQTQPDSVIAKFFTNFTDADKSIIASYAFGLQLLSIFVSAFLCLLFARSLQAWLYNPGGFKTEILSFRARKIALVVLLVLFLGSTKQNLIAIMLLPAIFVYFLLSGASICAGLINKNHARFMFVVLVPMVIFPIVAAPFYGFLGLFDSLYSLRFYSFKRRNRG